MSLFLYIYLHLHRINHVYCTPLASPTSTNLVSSKRPNPCGKRIFAKRFYGKYNYLVTVTLQMFVFMSYFASVLFVFESMVKVICVLCLLVGFLQDLSPFAARLYIVMNMCNKIMTHKQASYGGKYIDLYLTKICLMIKANITCNRLNI